VTGGRHGKQRQCCLRFLNFDRWFMQRAHESAALGAASALSWLHAFCSPFGIRGVDFFKGRRLK
jgi:hypothetical protein